MAGWDIPALGTQGEIDGWVAAGTVLARDPRAAVLCPVCQEAHLTVLDSPLYGSPPRIDRHLWCKRCGAKNIVSGIKPTRILGRLGPKRIALLFVLLWTLCGAVFWVRAVQQDDYRTSGEKVLGLPLMVVLWPVALYRDLFPVPPKPPEFSYL